VAQDRDRCWACVNEVIFLTRWEPVIFSSKTLLHGVSNSLILLQDYRFYHCGLDSSVGIATDYRLDGPGSNPGGDEIFHPSRPSLGPTQPPVKLVPGLSRGKVRPGRAADHTPPSSAAVMEE
jgi:hypothetical protein